GGDLDLRAGLGEEEILTRHAAAMRARIEALVGPEAYAGPALDRHRLLPVARDAVVNDAPADAAQLLPPAEGDAEVTAAPAPHNVLEGEQDRRLDRRGAGALEREA